MGIFLLIEDQPWPYGNISDYDQSTGAFDWDGDDSFEGADDNIPVVLKAGEADEDNVFTDARPGMVCGIVKTDTDKPMGGVRLWLYADNDDDGSPDGEALDSTLSDGDAGTYCFNDVTPGSYVVVELQPDFHNSVSDYDHSTGAGDTDGDDFLDGPDDQIPVVITPGEEDEDNDFIEDPIPGEIHGVVTDDLGAPLDSVRIFLYYDLNQDWVPEGSPIDTALTNITGAYAFTGVEPDGYLLIEEQPLNYTSISDFDESNDGDGNDNFLGANDQIPVVITAGENDSDNNFKEGRPGLICGNVRNDRGDPLGNVTVTLYVDADSNQVPDGPAIDSVLSDSLSGNYCFESIPPGLYLLEGELLTNYSAFADYDFSVDSSDLDGDDSAEGPDGNIPVNLVPGESDTGNDFIQDPAAAFIRGQSTDDIGIAMLGAKIRLFEDFDADGEPDGSAIDSTTIAPDGTYSFDDLYPGDYVVVETQILPYGDIYDYDLTPDPDGDDDFQGPDNNIPVTLKAGEDDTDNDFKNSRPGSICGQVVDDLNSPLGNIPILLYADSDGDGDEDGVPLDTVLSDGDSGDFCFYDVAPGLYVLVEDQPGSFGDLMDYDQSTGVDDMDGVDTIGGPDNDIPVDLKANEDDEDNIFVDVACPESPQLIGDSAIVVCVGNAVVFQTSDQNLGSESYNWDFGEGATPAVATGPGPHIVYYDTTAANQDSGAEVSLTVSKTGCSAQSATLANVLVRATPVAAIDAPSSSLCYYQYRTFEADVVEPGVEYLWDFGSLASPSTATGAGPHQVYFTQVGVTDVELIAKSVYSETTCPDTATLSFEVLECLGNIAGNVRTEGGVGVGNVLIFLYKDVDMNGLPDDTTAIEDLIFTTAGGQFLFLGVKPGNYVLRQSQPQGYTSVKDEDLSADGDSVANLNPLDDIIPVTVEPSITDLDNNFTESVNPGSIEGYVFEDLNDNDSPDPGEGIDSVMIRLFADFNKDGKADGVGAVDSVLTDTSGFYSFTGVSPNTFVLVEEQPDGYYSIADVDASEDVDDVPNTNQQNDTLTVTIEPDENDRDNFFIETIVIPNIVVNTFDSGPGSLRYAVENTMNGDTVWFIAGLAGDTIQVTSQLINIDKDLVIYFEHSPRVWVESSVSGLFTVASGKTVEIIDLNMISGDDDDPAAVDNQGILTLNNVTIRKNPALPDDRKLISNTGHVIVKGEVRILK